MYDCISHMTDDRTGEVIKWLPPQAANRAEGQSFIADVCTHVACPQRFQGMYTADEEKPKLQACAQCGIAKYCGTACQKAGWKWHKPKCQLYWV